MAIPVRPKASKAVTCRMFDTPLIEFFSRIHPVTAFLFWVPTIAFLAYWPLRNGMPIWRLAAWAAGGWLAWTLTEYLLHRYVFHYLRPSAGARRFHFVLHGVHHDFPQDVMRLVMPLGVSIPLGMTFFFLAYCVVPLGVAMASFAGFAGGYLLYDGVHYFTHHLRARTRLGKYLKRYHMVHHHTGVDGLYGVSQPLWDFVFGSQVDRRTKGAQRSS